MGMQKFSREDIISDVKSGLRDAESLLQEAARASGDKAAELRNTALDTLKRASDSMIDLQETVRLRGKAAARATDDYVHDYPWRALGMAAAAGFVVGVLLSAGRR